MIRNKIFFCLRLHISAIRYMTFIGLILFSTLNASAQADTASFSQAIVRIRELLREKYIISEKIKTLTDSVGIHHDKEITAEEFVETINIDLFRYSHDKHLSLEYNPLLAQRLLNNSNPNDEQRKDEKRTNYGFEKLEILPDNIGFLKLTYFADAANLEELIRSVFTFLKNTDALVIDLRGNSGGSGSMLQKLISGLLPERSTSILAITYKDRTVQLKSDSKPLFSYHKPVFLLCDRKTFSAGEGFAFILQNRKRGMVIGETTAGAGNIAGPHPVDKNFVITIPVGIIVDPLTGKGWEGSGVVPDVEISAENALQKALDILKHK